MNDIELLKYIDKVISDEHSWIVSNIAKRDGKVFKQFSPFFPRTHLLRIF